jgi:hypothetical protein
VVLGSLVSEFCCTSYQREKEKETESGPRIPPLPPPPLLHNMLHADFVTLIRHMLVASVYKTVDYEKHMRVSKPSRIFEARPPSYRVKIKLGYESLLIQCISGFLIKKDLSNLAESGSESETLLEFFWQIFFMSTMIYCDINCGDLGMGTEVNLGWRGNYSVCGRWSE